MGRSLTAALSLPGMNAGVSRANWMNERDKEFLLKLADPCEEYDASFDYTTDDDGIHISVDGREVFVGFLIDASKELRKAISFAEGWET